MCVCVLSLSRDLLFFHHYFDIILILMILQSDIVLCHLLVDFKQVKFGCQTLSREVEGESMDLEILLSDIHYLSKMSNSHSLSADYSLI